MTRAKYSELRSQMTPESRKRARKMTEKHLAEMEIHELRDKLKITQPGRRPFHTTR
jgi:DNA-binding transcriptional regulator YiaG